MNTRYDTKPYQDPLTPVISGFVPGLDVASDVSDMATAIEDKDKIGMILASLGFLPVVGGAASYASKARKLDGRVKAIRISEPPENLYIIITNYLMVLRMVMWLMRIKMTLN